MIPEFGVTLIKVCKIMKVQWNLDLVTIDLVTIFDLVTLLPMTNFLLSKIHRFSDKFANFSALI